MKEAKGVRNAATAEFQFGRDSDAGSKLTQCGRRGLRRANPTTDRLVDLMERWPRRIDDGSILPRDDGKRRPLSATQDQKFWSINSATRPLADDSLSLFLAGRGGKGCLAGCCQTVSSVKRCNSCNNNGPRHSCRVPILWGPVLVRWPGGDWIGALRRSCSSLDFSRRT